MQITLSFQVPTKGFHLSTPKVKKNMCIKFSHANWKFKLQR